MVDNEKMRWVGLQQGMVHALATIRRERNYAIHHLRSIPSRHVRKRAPLEIEVAALTKVYDLIERDLRKIQNGT